MNKLPSRARRMRTAGISLLAFAGRVVPALAMADTGYYLVSTYDVEGQTSVDFKYWNARYPGKTVAAPDLGLAMASPRAGIRRGTAPG